MAPVRLRRAVTIAALGAAAAIGIAIAQHPLPGGEPSAGPAAAPAVAAPAAAAPAVAVTDAPPVTVSESS